MKNNMLVIAAFCIAISLFVIACPSGSDFEPSSTTTTIAPTHALLNRYFVAGFFNSWTINPISSSNALYFVKWYDDGTQDVFPDGYVNYYPDKNLLKENYPSSYSHTDTDKTVCKFFIIANSGDSSSWMDPRPRFRPTFTSDATSDAGPYLARWNFTGPCDTTDDTFSTYWCVVFLDEAVDTSVEDKAVKFTLTFNPGACYASAEQTSANPQDLNGKADWTDNRLSGVYIHIKGDINDADIVAPLDDYPY